MRLSKVAIVRRPPKTGKSVPLHLDILKTSDVYDQHDIRYFTLAYPSCH